MAPGDILAAPVNAMIGTWTTGPVGKVTVAAAMVALAAVCFLCLGEAGSHDRDVSMAWCSGAVASSLLGLWLVGPCATGRVPALASLFAYALSLHLPDPPPKLTV
jgi:hypothetical protein